MSISPASGFQRSNLKEEHDGSVILLCAEIVDLFLNAMSDSAVSAQEQDPLL